MEFVVAPHVVLGMGVDGYSAYFSVRRRGDLNAMRFEVARRKAFHLPDLMELDIYKAPTGRKDVRIFRYDAMSGLALQDMYLRTVHAYLTIASRVETSRNVFPLFTLRFSWIDGLYKRIGTDVPKWTVVDGIAKI